MSELRKDPIVDRWVIVAEGRAERPGAFLQPTTEVRLPALPAGVAADCPFCAGQEARTPPAVYERTDGQGRWTVRIVPNKYPAVQPHLAFDRGKANHGSAVGVHEVVVESPWHATDLVELSGHHLAQVLVAWRDRLAEHRRSARWKSVILFKNMGREAGASIEHVHSQIVALPRVPELVLQEVEAAARYHQRHGQCAFCHLIAREREAATRVLIDRAGFLAVTAFAGRQPYETWILPVEHARAYESEGDRRLADLASVLAQLLPAVRQVLPICAYNLILHTAPFDTCSDDRYHWHIEIIPRISGLAGYELGGGEFINPLSPERAAREIKGNLTDIGQL
jgi:UDPglucose--hexose-1-phosphate uridylyltransferase